MGSIKSALYYKKYVYLNGTRVVNCKTYKCSKICDVCWLNKEREFVKTKCGYIICLNCLKRKIDEDRAQLCPVCKICDWYERIIEWFLIFNFVEWKCGVKFFGNRSKSEFYFFWKRIVSLWVLWGFRWVWECFVVEMRVRCVL